jgi:hypothetical protein
MKKISQLLLSTILLAAACITASAQSLTGYFPGGYQSRVQGLDTVNSYLLTDNVSLSWDWGVGSYGAYTLPGSTVVYDKVSKVFYLRYQTKGGDIHYFGPLYSPTNYKDVTDYFPGPTQYLASGSYTAKSYFLSDNVTLNWNSQLARTGAYVLSDAKVAYDAGHKKFYLYDGLNWFGPLY